MIKKISCKLQNNSLKDGILKFVSHSPVETQSIGHGLGKLLEAGDVVCLSGGLGAGKTVFTKGVAGGLGVTDSVTSPTFAIINEYTGRLPVYHVDVYRIDREEELADTGLDEYLYGNGVTIIEWADRFRGMLPGQCLWIEIKADSINDIIREIIFRPEGKRDREIVEAIKRSREGLDT